jgi:hypothetical protein
MSSHSARTAAVATLVLALMSHGCGRPAQENLASNDPTQLVDGHERMLAVLKEIEARTSDENKYLGDGKARQLEQHLAGLPSDTHPMQKLQLLWQLAEAQLQSGATEKAIEQFERCENLLAGLRAFLKEADAVQIQNDLDFKLAVASLRVAEDQNCVHCRNEDCCIFPIRGGGVHVNQAPARSVIERLTKYLERNPKDPTGIWLINVAYMTVGEYPDEVPEKWLLAAETFESDSDFPRFKNIAPDLGLDHVSLCGGMVVDDLNADGWLDVVTSTWSTSGQILCRMADGNGSFTDTTTEAGLTGLYGGLNLVQADYDNDGDVDILVLRGAWLDQAGKHPNSLLENDGQGRFRDVTFDVGLGDNHYPTQSAAWADYDNDGDLDLYIANEIGPSELFNNDGAGHFQNVAFAAGVANGGSPKGVIWGDYDNDRYPDIYVSNFVGPNRLFHNNRNGTFTDVAHASGVAGPNRSFPTWFWDFNNDGALDIFVAAYWSDVDHFATDFLGRPGKAETDRLYQGDGKGGFRDVTEEMRLARVTLPMGSNFGDVDNDGYPDFYLGTGYPDYEGVMPNRMFHNQSGKEFFEVTTAAGVGHLQKGHGVAFADFDHDGDEDIFIEMGGAFPGDGFADAVFQNPGFGNHWLVVKLTGTRSNRAGIGARIRADIKEGEASRTIYKWVNSGGSFGGSPLRQHIGLGSASQIESLEIYWPTSDETQRFKNVAADQMIEVVEGQSDYRLLEVR